MNGIERQSALHDRHLQAGAPLQMVRGWRLPAHYGQEKPIEQGMDGAPFKRSLSGVVPQPAEPFQELEQVRQAAGVSDASWLTKIDLRGRASGLPVERPSRLWVLTPNHALITSPEPIAFAPSFSVTDVTSIWSAILLAGPRARQVMAKLTSLNVREGAMANGAARQARIAHANSIVLRVDSMDVPGFLILNTRDLAGHVWDALLHAGSEWGARPFGLVAQQKWLGAA